MISLFTSLRRHLKEVYCHKTSAQSIALGFSVGTFLAILPTFGFGILIGGVVILIWKNISKVALIAAFAFWNPLMLIPIYTWCYWLGGILYGGLPVERYEIEILNQFFTFTRRFLVANFIIALLMSVLVYTVSYFLVRAIRPRTL